MMLKPFAYEIVTLLCQGKKTREIEAKLGLTHYHFEKEFRKIRIKAGLPKQRYSYVACKDLIDGNLAKMDSFIKKCEEDNSKYMESLHKFDF